MDRFFRGINFYKKIVKVNVFSGMIAVDHIRSISKSRINDYIGKLRNSEIQSEKHIHSKLKPQIMNDLKMIYTGGY